MRLNDSTENKGHNHIKQFEKDQSMGGPVLISYIESSCSVSKLGMNSVGKMILVLGSLVRILHLAHDKERSSLIRSSRPKFVQSMISK